MKSKKIIIAILFIFLTINISIAINNYAVDFISNQKDREGGFLIGSKPYEIKKDPDTTILLVHGVISSPKDFKELSEYLSSRNISVSAMLLPGHGTHPKDLATKTYLDWTSSVDEELDKINSKNKFLLGYSLGGTLTLNAARTNELDGIITINAPIELQNKFV
ncbi:MAG: hypothetical protein CMH62_02410, partial [Nanoarchaeota archaeon]|nr:hypothetical protein [Nanoarchaeota archaeon]